MKKVLRLTENDLIRLVKRIVNEQYDYLRYEDEFEWDIQTFDCEDEFSDVPFENRKEIDYDFESNTISISMCEGDEDNLAEYKIMGIAQAIEGYGRIPNDEKINF